MTEEMNKENGEMPTISTPLQQIKRKRQNNEMESNKKSHQRPRKKIYRPKVIGEGRPRKTRAPTAPNMAENKFVHSNSKPKTPSPVIPNRPYSKSRTKKFANSKVFVKKKKKTAKDHESLVPVTEIDNVVNASEISSCRRDLNFDEDAQLESGKIFKAAVIENDIKTLENEIPNCESDSNDKQLVLFEADKAMADVNVPNENEKDRQCSMLIVYQRKIKSNENQWLHLTGQDIPKAMKKKRTSGRRKINKLWMKGWNFNSCQTKLKNDMKLRSKTTMRKQNGSDYMYWPTFIKRKRSPMVRSSKFAGLSAFPLLPSCFKKKRSRKVRKSSKFDAPLAFPSSFKRRRSPMIRRSNLAALSAIPVCNQLVRNHYKNAIKNEKIGNLSGNDSSERMTQRISTPAMTDGNNGQIILRWLEMEHFLTNSKFFNDGDENPPKAETGLNDVDSKGSMGSEQDSTLVARYSGSIAEITSTFNNLQICNGDQENINYLEHIKLSSEPRAHDATTLKGELDSFQEKLLIPYPTDGYYQEAQFELPPANVNINCITGVSNDDSRKEGFDSSKGQIIKYVSNEGKQMVQQKENPSSVGREIVPYNTPSNSNKKKREVDRICLDPRDIEMWKLVIKSESNFGKEKVDINTEEWWENERRVFRGRIDAFVARLHLILGDRRFTPWKGSVVDSVVGVFLTQNVSDHLSSSAFMSLAATFPLPSTRKHTENHGGQEALCIQEPSARSQESFEGKSTWNNQCRKTVVDLEVTEELMSANDETVSQDFQVLFVEEDCKIYESSNAESPENKDLHFVEGYISSQNSTLSFESNPESRILESNEIDYRYQNPTSENLKCSDTTLTLESHGQCYPCPECSCQSRRGFEKNPEIFNCCQEILGVDFQLTSYEESQRLIYARGVGKDQTQEIQSTNNCNANCCMSTASSSNPTESRNKQNMVFYNYHQEKTEIGPQLSSIDESSKKVVANVEEVQSQESKIQAPNNGNNTKTKGKKGKQKNIKENISRELDNDTKEIPKGNAKTMKNKQDIDLDSLQKKWDSMRTAYSSHEPRSSDHMDSVDWEAVRCAEHSKLANAIKERGQHNIIAARIKEFLEEAKKDGSIDLEWLKNAPPDDVKQYLLGINGLGLKSVECIRLLALQQVAFPVDINVGRIAVRLGWVPLQPLPEEVQIHLLDQFPMMDSIQKYLWPRLCTLDQRSLYELHYQLITFGKVFCTKRKPNCNACPLKGECRHYASAAASARLALPGPPEKGIVRPTVPDNNFEGTADVMNPTTMLQIEGNPFLGSRNETTCEPIIDEPPSPEHECAESSVTDIEDLFEYDSDDILTIRLNSGKFATSSPNCMHVVNISNQDYNNTRALVPLSARAASIPMRKLKHIDRLRTEHQVYELPDGHPLLFELDRRDPNDPCPYLLCILTPGETVKSSESPKTRCMHRVSEDLCSDTACSSCNIIREQTDRMIQGTILIPCRTAMRGAFPLNGTYFQVNEVFADDETSKKPVHFAREWIWNLPRRIAYFGTSTTTIFRGLAEEDIRYCFQRGFICVRGFDRKTRTPQRLVERLHRSTVANAAAAAAVARKKKANKSEEIRQ